MKPFRRAVSLVSGIFVLQLTLLGAAVPCTDSAMAHEGADAAQPTAGECGEHESEQSAPTQPATPQCYAMVSCVTPLVQLAEQPAIPFSVSASAVVMVPVLEPPTRNTIPELPPPRA